MTTPAVSASTDDGSDPVATSTNNPFMQMFTTFRDEIDEHHERRERVIKVSRDVTAASKKMIFTLQRLRSLTTAIPPYILKDTRARLATIHALLITLTSDLQGLNAHRYARQISGGLQEFMEAVAFEHYIISSVQSSTSTKNGSKGEGRGRLPSYAEAQEKLPEGWAGLLSIEDYMGGLFDCTGEMMKLAITIIATTPLSLSSSSGGGGVPQAPPILTHLRDLRTLFDALDTSTPRAIGTLGKDVGVKLRTMRTCVEKVEFAVYGMLVRGSERPVGWVPRLEGVEGGGGRGGDED